MNPWDDFTVDHMVPQTHGGGDEITNLAPACKTCNSRKNAKTVDGYRDYLLGKQEMRFWGERLACTSKDLAVLQPEENALPVYTRDLQRYINHAMRVGLRQSPGYAVTIMVLMMHSLNSIEDREHEGLIGHGAFHIKALAERTCQNIDTVFGHLMSLHQSDLVTVDWNAAPNDGHWYHFNFEWLTDDEDHRRYLENKSSSEPDGEDQPF
jgi:hypothetical protein